MTPDQIRDSYLAFFKEREHAIVPSSPVVPEGDPTLLFANAGMNQFKDVLLGNEVRAYTRAASVQKCVRAGGKHNDLDEVGRDGRHLTFFEMLGNWSFGDYYKRDAIRWAWEYATTVLKFDISRLYVTVHHTDAESRRIWEDEIGVAPERVLDQGQTTSENFWSMGDTGPCGPCTEIHYDLHPELGPFSFTEGGYDEDRVIEFWNLVFMESNRLEDGSFVPLPLQSVDTGMGLDRVALILAGRDNIFQTELFAPLLLKTAELLGMEVASVEEIWAHAQFADFSVIADHIRTVTFALADGAQFGNVGRGSVLRSILRRAVRHGKFLGLDRPFMHEMAAVVIERYGAHYPELVTVGEQVMRLIQIEEERFLRTIDRGLNLFNELVEQATASEEVNKKLSGDDVFELHATYGFPWDMTRIMAIDAGLSIDEARYHERWAEHIELSRGKNVYEGVVGVGDWQTLAEGDAANFVGYTAIKTSARVLKLHPVDGGQIELLLDQTPFYAESGGQVGDVGTITGDGVVLRVVDTQKAPIGIVHRCEVVSGTPSAATLGGQVIAEVDADARAKSMCNHTATHLLHAALRDEVSDGIFQAGSLVSPQKLRFDFSLDRPVTGEEIARIEARVNRQIREGHPVQIHVDVERQHAIDELGAMAIFGEKYGDRVRVIEIPGESVELCGGTHVANTKDIALFRITSETGVSAGVRRVEAITQQAAFEAFLLDRARVDAVAAALKTDADHLEQRAQSLLDERQDLERQVQRLNQRLAVLESRGLVDDAADIQGVKVLAKTISADTRDQLLAYADRLRESLDEAAILLGAEIDGKAALLCMVTDAAFKNKGIKAGALINAVASHVDGRGGGRPTLAQAGGANPAGLPAAIAAFEDAVRATLG